QVHRTYHYFVSRLLTVIINLLSGIYLTDMETCYKMIRTDLWKSIPIVSRDFRFEVEITIKLAKRAARMFEIPIRYSGRTYAEGKKINWVDGLRALIAIGRFALSSNIIK
ncbi:MAG: glycosyl transferase family 2, partial [Acidobacteria bacterium]|nr:glycosyl transferase family 2 [Acidobacteriota bacterium]